MNEGMLLRALDLAGIAAPVRWDDVTTSTNDTALRMAREGTPEWTLVAAGHQTEGRGRHGRVWVDRPGRALLCSVVLRPAVALERLGLVSLAAGAAMAEAASTISALDVRCKWPNDLIVDDAKVGGVLAASEVTADSLRHVVVGAGVNLDAPAAVPGAGTIGEVDVQVLLASYLFSLRELMASPEEILFRWVAVSDTLGRRVEATTVGGDAARGVAADLDETGALLIDTDRGRVRVAFGEIRHLRDRFPDG